MTDPSGTPREHPMTIDHPEVQESVTYEDNDEYVVAVVPTSYASAVAIREHLWKHHALSASVVVLRTLPTTTDGAVDLGALAAEVAALDESRKSRYVPPAGDLEQHLATLVADVLDIDRVGVLDDFMDLGGDSIHLIQLSTLITQRFGADLSLEEFFEAPTVRDLTRVVQHRG